MEISVSVFYIVFISLFTFIYCAQNQYANKRTNPLLGEDGRRHQRATECHFGKTFKELGSSWYADLGPPFGVMYCIRCDCVPMQKKRRIVAKVQCRNIKNECPKPTCKEPILLPNKCCKVCPGDPYLTSLGPDTVQDVAAPEDDRNMKHFGALLTGRTSLVFKRDDVINIPSTSKLATYQIIATGRFAFHKKNLYFSFYLANSLGENPQRPRTIQFINYKGDLLAEQNLGSNSVYQNKTGKLCGVWRRVPREYKRLLRDETLYVALLWGNDFAISGQIARFKALATEQFSALMTPYYSPLLVPDHGATAIISTVSSPPSLHISLIFNGLFTSSETHDIPIIVKMERSEGGENERTVFVEEIRIPKASHELNFGEVRLPISAGELRLLNRGKLTLSLMSKSDPGLLSVSGPVVTRVACEVFQTCLSPSSDLEGMIDAQETTLMLPFNPTTGLAWLYLNKDGSLVYNIKLKDVEETPSLALVTAKGRKWPDIQYFTPSSFVNGLATGTLDKLTPRALELLYAGDLSINVGSAKSGVVRGQLTSRSVADVIDTNSPFLLKKLDKSGNADLVGMVWLSIDFDCDLHYDVQLTDQAGDLSLQLHLEGSPLLAPGAPVFTRLLEEFNGTTLEGFTQLNPDEIGRIDSGVSFLQIKDAKKEDVLLKTDLKPLKIPMECLPHSTDNDVPSFISSGPNTNRINEITKCYHEGVFHEEGSQWKHPKDSCKMCHCLRGKESCDEVVCPELPCIHKFKPQSGECCSSCHNTSGDSNTSSGCWLAGQFHPGGSSWHPYLPPNGFNLCTVITCEAYTNSIRYSRVQCPPLNCPDKETYRPDKNSCCKKCKVAEEGYARDQSVQDVKEKKTDREILREGGCMHLGKGPYANNSEWTHFIPTIGVIPCVSCRCKNGTVSCGRKRCMKSCASLSQDPHVDECCLSQCRYRRQSRNRKQRGRAHKKTED